MGCIYNGVCSSLVDLFLWQQVTHLAAVTANCGISASRFGSLSTSGFEFFVDLCNLREICVSIMRSLSACLPAVSLALALSLSLLSLCLALSLVSYSILLAGLGILHCFHGQRARH